MLVLFFILFIVGCFFCFTHENGVIPFVVLIGFLQDPARKLIAGEPVYMTILVGVLLGFAVLRNILIRPKSLTAPFVDWSQNISQPITIYLVLVGIQFAHALIRYGTLIVPALGSVFYLAPLVAISIGYSQFPRFQAMRFFLILFSVLAVIVAVTVLMSYNGIESPIFGEVGFGLVIYDQGTVLKAHSGLMRSSEIASWHMGACVCFLIILWIDRNSLSSTAITVGLITLLMSAIVLTGRRKMIAQIFVFSVLYLPLLRFYQGRLSASFLSGIAIAIALLWLTSEFFFSGSNASTFDLYLRRGSSVFGDATGRFEQLGLGSIRWAIQRFGLLGGGLGVAAQGAQHFTGALASGAAEGGLGKIVSELGVIALFIGAWMIYATGSYVNQCIKLVARHVPPRLPLIVGVFCFIIANAPTFFVASQVYGDIFVLLVIGLLFGFLFATPRQVITELKQRESGVKPA